ncbi:MFS transporter [Bacillus lacus]|uniref:MFS transporter n=1 Tax=Metabacillus lacus TaxID=1983721 RepID=A0A7X2J1A6_9BACI|nr:MFS transporter [Metabacillus lacus]MRX73555.1 MFS transporter [Metabacillus lacus]
MELNSAPKTEEPTVAKPLAKNISFLILIFTSFISSGSLSMFLFTQSWFVISELHFSAGLGFIFIASSIPRILLMLVGGVLADRIKKTSLILFSMLTEVLLVGTVLVCLLAGIHSIWIFVLAALFFGISDAIQIPARTSLLPALVHPSQLTRANSSYSLISQISMIAGAFSAGLLLKHVSYSFTLSIIGLSLLAASLLIPLISLPGRYAASEDSRADFWESLKEGFSYIRKSAFLKALLMFAIFINFFLTGPVTIGIPIIANKLFSGSAMAFSYLEGAFIIGMLAGSFIMGVWNLQKARGRFVTFCIGMQGIFYLFFSFSKTLFLLLFFISLMGLMISFVNTPLQALVQHKVDSNMLGRG